MKRLLMLIGVCAAMVGAHAQDDMKRFIDDLMGRMTLEEKLGQLNLMVAGDITTGAAMNNQVAGDIAAGKMGGIFNIKGADKIKALQQVAVEKSRLGIPLIVGMDVIHGYETIFPIPLALSCSWDLDAVERSARIAALEASADGINWTFSPMVDICIDARWGRVSEGNGEDPWLSGEIGKAMVRGYQGDYSREDNIMACVKHYALYGGSESGRDYNTVDMSRVRMYNQYLPPYRACAEAGVGTVMSSFNVVDGVPATANRWLLTEVLRGQWGYNGMVVTDYGSIGEILNHGTAADMQEASAQALNAGTDMDMCAQGFLGTLKKSIDEGKVSMEAVDQACRRVLEAKYKLGLFKNPYKYCNEKRRSRDIFTKENRQTARDIAAETFVLLKNENQTLPLKRNQKIALIGPLADTRSNMAGTWCVAMTPDRYSTLREAMAEAIGKEGTLLYAQGCNLTADEKLQVAAEFGKTIPRIDDVKGREEALKVARQADVIVCAMGECADMSGECASRSDLTLPDVQMELLRELAAMGKPVVLLNFSGRPTVLKWESENLPAILNVWFGGSEAAPAICDVVFGDKNPSGHLTMSMPQTTGQAPLYYNHLNTGRPVAEGARQFFKYQSNYLDVRNDPLYPFGYGLSYTQFTYSGAALSSATMQKDGQVEATVTVTNSGKRAGDEVVQLYIRDKVASISRPVKELKAFERIHLEPGASRQVRFTITPDMLKFYNDKGEKVLETGDFDIMVGANSSDVTIMKLKLQ